MMAWLNATVEFKLPVYPRVRGTCSKKAEPASASDNVERPDVFCVPSPPPLKPQLPERQMWALNQPTHLGQLAAYNCYPLGQLKC